jgi:malonyl-CoA decarboxylase
MAGDLSSTAPVNSTSHGHYKIGGPTLPVGPPGGHSAAVCEALERCHDLLSDRGAAPGNCAAGNVLAVYATFDETARAEFFDGLLARFSVDSSALHRPAEASARNRSDDTLQRPQKASEAPLRDLFFRLNGAPGATACLVRMREQLQNREAWATIESDLTDVLRLLFNRSVLDFQQIDLETDSPVLERLIEAEAVHPVADWRQMERRLEADRRCYAYFHPGWPQQPLVFTEVALTRGIASTLQPILDPDSAVVDPRTCDTAMFYSISNCQPGLRGFSLGNALLSRAIERLRAEMPWLRRFATISPIPGFRSWLSASSGSLNWSRDALLALCAHYLLRVKQGSEPADSVARFHLANGARLHRLNASSDLSMAGIRHSAGLTVNYVYELNELERNAETYRRSHEVRAVAEVARLARRAAPLLSNPSIVA